MWFRTGALVSREIASARILGDEQNVGGPIEAIHEPAHLWEMNLVAPAFELLFVLNLQQEPCSA